MTEAEWLTSTDPARMLALAKTQGSGRKLRLLAISYCQRVSAKITLPQSAEALRVADLYSEGAVDINAVLTAWDSVLAEKRAVGWGNGCWQITWVAQSALQGFGSQFWPENADAQQASLLISDDYPAEWAAQCGLLRDIFGNPFRLVLFSSDWRTSTAVALAAQMYEARDFSAMPILADALQDAGCDNADVLNHCRGPGPHVRGCWVVDMVLGKE